MDWQSYISLAALIAFLITGAGMWKGMFSKAARQQNQDLVSSSQTLTDFWKNQAEGFQSMMVQKEKDSQLMMVQKEKDWNDKFEKLTREIGELRGHLTASESQRAQYEAILKDRNPETDKFMKEVMVSLGEISTFMHSLNQHMEKQSQGFKVESVVTPDGSAKK